jgi:hypothetical protein
MSEQSPQLQSWYLARGGQQLGPYASNEILRLAETGQLRPDDLLWRPGLDGWKPVHTIPGFAAPHSDAIATAGPDAAVQMEDPTEPAVGAKPTEVTATAELKPTWRRIAAVAWLILWRSLVAGFLAGFAISFFGGFILEYAGYEQLEIRAITTILGWIAGLAVLVLVVPMALKKHYGEFRLAMVPHDASHDSN